MDAVDPIKKKKFKDESHSGVAIELVESLANFKT